MAKAPNKKLRRSAFFLSCFGVSREDKNFSEKIPPVNKVAVVEVESSNTGDKDKGTVPSDTTATGLVSSWSMFRMKNSSAKTVPLDTSSDKSTDLSENKIHSSKSSNSSKPKWKIHRLFTKRTNSTTKTMPFREIKTLLKEEMMEEGPEQNKTLEIRKSPVRHHANTSRDATCRKRLSFRRKIDAIRTGSSNQPGSPDVDVKPKPPPPPARTTDSNTGKAAAATLKHSVSMPVPTRDKRANQSSLKSRVVPKKTSQDDNAMVVNKFDPVVGMSIIVVTLIIMFVWGRLCAILCTSAWLYFVPLLRAPKNDDAAMVKTNGDLDLNSQEYKKRVVLEGFLERDHRAAPSL